MAHAISLTDGTTTVNLFDLAATFVVADGWALGSDAGAGGADEEVGESINLLLMGANGTAIQTIARNIERLLMGARRREGTGVGERVYLTAQLDGMSEVRRTPVPAPMRP